MTIAPRKKPLHHWLLVIVTGCAMSAFVYAQSPGAKPVVPQANPLEQQAGELQKALAESERKAADARAAAEAQRRRADEAEQRVREALKTKPAPQAAGINPAELQAARREAEQERALRQQAEVRVTAANERIAQLVKEVAALQGRLAAVQARSTVVTPQSSPPPAATPVYSAGTTSGIDKPCAECPELIVISPGSFVMGSPANEQGRDNDEGPQRKVTISYNFAVGKFEVTQNEWRAIMGNNPSRFSACGGTCPVEQVSWNEIQDFLKRLNAKTGQQYRLLTEAEWEYVARAGTTTRYSFGDNEVQLGNHAWFTANSGNTTHPVGQKQPNAWGLHDMHGNVWEWVQDCFVDNYNGAPVNGSAQVQRGCDRRVLRGGSWISYAQVVRAANRLYNAPDFRNDVIGFRIARTLF